MSVQPFCLRCDSILPLEITGNAVVCKFCKLSHSYSDLMNKEIFSSVIFNTRNDENDQDAKNQEASGPMTDRKCPQCGNDGMSYTTRQLRGADEGQTVFYLCPVCKYQDNENS